MSHELDRNIEIFKKRCAGAKFSDMALEYKISPSRVREIYKKIDWQVKITLEEMTEQKPVGKEERLKQIMRDFLKDMRDLNRETRKAISENSKRALKISSNCRHKLDREVWNHGSCVLERKA